MKKYCPLGFISDAWCYCSREECAWWDDIAKRCYFVTAARRIAMIWEVLAGHEGHILEEIERFIKKIEKEKTKDHEH